MNGLRYAKRRYLWALDKGWKTSLIHGSSRKSPTSWEIGEQNILLLVAPSRRQDARRTCCSSCAMSGKRTLTRPAGPKVRTELAVIVVSCCAMGYFNIGFPRHQLGIPGPLSPF